MSTKINIKTYIFEGQFTSASLPAFRGAVVKALGENNSLPFHNHLQDGLVYSYPKVQYKQINYHPAIVAIDVDTSSLDNIIHNGVLTIKLRGKELRLPLIEVFRQQYELEISDEPKFYQLSNYLPLNENNKDEYHKLLALTDKICKLEDIITGNILSLFKGLGMHIQDKIEVAITDIGRSYSARYKGVDFMAFDLSFVTNVVLPDFIGLGKSPSVGFGLLKKIAASS